LCGLPLPDAQADAAGAVRLMAAWERRLGQVVIGGLILLGLLYAGDCAVLRLRIAHGTAYGVVEVHQFLATPLKGNKVEYDLMGTVQQPCSRSIFPQKGNPACWWLKRHTSQWE
jgi:hypothetical protein